MNPASYPTAGVPQAGERSTTRARSRRAAYPGASLVTALKTRFTAFANRFVPVGYEDETGFHPGEPTPSDPIIRRSI